MSNIQPIFLNAVDHKGKVTQKQIRDGIEGLYFDDCDAVVAVGSMVHKALETLRIEHYHLPHPSGRNFLLNDPNYILGKIEGLRKYLNERAR